MYVLHYKHEETSSHHSVSFSSFLSQILENKLDFRFPARPGVIRLSEVCCSPAASNLEETAAALKLASRAAKVVNQRPPGAT